VAVLGCGPIGLFSIGIAKASGNTPRDKAGNVTKAHVTDIAKQKQQDLNSHDLDAAVRMVEGTARSMGIDVVEAA
jgi:large subunit ribosomal protein L11